MNLEALKIFLTLAEEKNFTTTSKKLLISQPSVSLHIKNLEEELQTKLFWRTTKQLKITPEGLILYEKAKQVLHLVEQINEEIKQRQGTISGVLKIGASFTAGEYLLPRILSSLTQKYPDMNLEIEIGNTNNVAERINSLELDIGIIEGDIGFPDLRSATFFSDELFIVANCDHPLTVKKEVDIQSLQDQTWIKREEGSNLRVYLDQFLSSNQLREKHTVVFNSNEGIKEAIIHGAGMSLLSSTMIERELLHGYMGKVQFTKQVDFHRKFAYLYSPFMENNLLVRTFIEELQDNPLSLLVNQMRQGEST